jgi:bacillithiol system protein YtxJ
MSIFDSLFSSKSDKSSFENWNALESLDHWSQLVEQSFQNTVVVFKHSTRCFISRSALNNFQSSWLTAGTPQTFYLLDLLSYRSVSDAIAKDTLVHHQSPQIIVLKDGKAVYTASHDAISFDSVLEFL